MNIHSKHECPKCSFTYSSPIAGTDVAHMCKVSGASKLTNAKRVWSSRFDKIARKR